MERFEAGSTVIYGVHGKCTIKAIEERNIDDTRIAFYRLEVQKSPLSRSNKKDPSIWVPVNAAGSQGLRAPITASDAEAVKNILCSREYFFSLNEPWSVVQPKLESTIRSQGCIGLAKVASYLFVLNRKFLIPNSEASQLQTTVNKLLFKELAEALNLLPKTLEEQMNKAMRPKLALNN